MTKSSTTQFDWDIVPSPDVIKALWKEAIFVFDTNVLLDIYRSQPETRNLLLETLKGLENKSWLPHRVAYEFRRNRRSVIAEANFNLSELQKTFDENFQDFISNVEKNLNNIRNFPADAIYKIVNSYQEANTENKKSIEAIVQDFPKFNEHDEILENIKRIYVSNVGLPYSSDDLEEIIKEGKERIANNIPPALTDSSKGTEEDQLGDFIIWKQIIDYSRKNKKNIIFVTSEKKSDWWIKEKGRRLGLPYILLEEFSIQTNSQKIHMYHVTQFLQMYKENINPKIEVNAAIIEDINALQNEKSERLAIITSYNEESSVENPSIREGTLTINLLKEAYKFTSTITLKDKLPQTPDNIWVDLIESPEALNECDIRCLGSTGTSYDINFHLKSYQLNQKLIPGNYVLKFRTA
ncbi:PIN domain-containing protein [Acinetobacter baumannii]|uniref:PIN domain-containing protein n=1 Tax=Acinetobacter baumannii TaxID=470 RepID=UPI00233FB5F4|nr:PIN domain-containing protein [Acinetobacter baumannii]MDC5321843.1 PIN domain-containing protein [Acinetobacter baumannii]MDV7615279.1 PIN domain-containing protein [Acinetobacter baumannii]